MLFPKTLLVTGQLFQISANTAFPAFCIEIVDVRMIMNSSLQCAKEVLHFPAGIGLKTYSQCIKTYCSYRSLHDRNLFAKMLQLVEEILRKLLVKFKS